MTTVAAATPKRSMLAAVALPFAAAAGFFAAGLVVMHDLRTNEGSNRTLDQAAIQSIEFVSQPDSVLLADALEDACAVTGCDPTSTAKLVRAGVHLMTEAELNDALRAQALTLGDLTTQMEISTDAELTSALQAQYTAEAEITALYRTELRGRALSN